MIKNRPLSLSLTELNRLFPFFLMLDQDFKLESFGTSMQKLFPDLVAGKHYSNDWNVDRPLIDTTEPDHLKMALGKLVIISNKANPELRFKGQLEKLENENSYVFIGSLWFNNSDQLIEYGLSVGDFALHNSMIDLFHVKKNNEISNSELQEVLQKVNEQKKRLLADQKSLRRKEKMLQSIAEATDELLSNQNVNEAISNSLGIIGASVEIGRVCFYEKHVDQNNSSKIVLHSEWKSVLVKEVEEDVVSKVMFLSQMKTAAKRLTSRLPYEAIFADLNEDDPLKMFMAHKGVKSMMIVPVFVNDQFHGILNFKDCNNERRWSSDEQSLFKSFANSVASAIERNETANDILNTNKQLTLFQGLINNSSDPVGVAHQDGSMFYINKAASKRVGIAVEDCTKYHVSDFKELLINNDTWDNNLKKLKEFESITLEGENFDHSTGETLSVETTFNYIRIGGEGFVIANSRDTSERKKNEQKLKLQEEKYHNIIANMNLGLMEVNLDDEIQYCNRSFTEMSGYSLEEVEGKNAIELFGLDEKDRFLLDKKEERKNGKADSYEIVVRNKNGDLRWWLISGAPNYNDAGEITGTVGIHLDVTDQKRLDKKLESALSKAKAASAAKEAFLANMSHEIRTPLNGIIGMVRELGKLDLTQTQKPLLEGAKKASTHLLSIVTNILDLSKIEAGELAIDKSLFSLYDVCDDVKNILSNQFTDKGLLFDIIVDTNLSRFLIGDSSRIRQVLLNIAGNALKFTNKGFVRISCKVNRTTEFHQEVELKIRDSGIGMDQKYVDRIFTKFQQEDISRSRKFEGTGLGMVITKELIDLMGGRISVNSKKMHGTEVTVRLTMPLGEASKEYYSTKQPDYKFLENKRLLLVEDNELNRLVATQVLLPLKMKITEVVNGAKAVELIRTKKFDIILMDLQMPVMGGLEATRIIRSELKNQIPIIAISANAFKSEVDACMQVGMNDYVTKPFDEQDLPEAIRQQLEQPGEESSNRKKTESAPPQKPTALYNLSKLTEMSRGNSDFVNKMLGLFVDSAIKSTLELEIAMEKGNIDTIRKLAHKLKPSLDNLEIDSIHVEIRKLESFEPNTQSNKQLSALVNKVSNTLVQTSEAIIQNELST
ncbi:MAG: PAS domain S-box-containing protein [Bacteroidia bacterium]|jgi:PAS domain S-box-containing protein